MLLKVKRGVKATVLGAVAHRSASKPDPLSATALRMIRVELREGLPGGYQGGAKAAACVSVDFDVTSPERTPWNRLGTAALLRLSEKHGIPFTWAICGRTAEEEPDAYQSILSSSVRQDMGVHTYSHIYADECTEGEYEEDIERCIRVMGLPGRPASFVFPKNREGHFPLLRRLGFKTYRGALRAIGAPVQDEGLWNIRPVYYVDGKSLNAAPLIRKYIDACIARSGVFHVWTHPWSLAIDGSVERMADDLVDPVLSYLEEMRGSGAISVATMSGLASFMGSAQ